MHAPDLQLRRPRLSPSLHLVLFRLLRAGRPRAPRSPTRPRWERARAGFDTFILLLLVHLGVRKLEAVFAVLVAVMAVSFGVMSMHAGVPAGDVAHGAFVPE